MHMCFTHPACPGLQTRPAPSLPISEERHERHVDRPERHDPGKSFNLEGAWRGSTAMSPGCPAMGATATGAMGARGAMAMAMGHFSQPRKEAPGSPKRVMQPPPRFTPGYLSSARMTRRRIT